MSTSTLSPRPVSLRAGGEAATPRWAACTPAAPAAPKPTTGAAAGAPAKPAGALPSYIPNTTGPKPDFASAGPQFQDGFINYPKNPVKALPATPPGLGSKVQCYTNNSAPAPPTPLEQNQAWQT